MSGAAWLGLLGGWTPAAVLGAVGVGKDDGTEAAQKRGPGERSSRPSVAESRGRDLTTDLMMHGTRAPVHHHRAPAAAVEVPRWRCQEPIQIRVDQEARVPATSQCLRSYRRGPAPRATCQTASTVTSLLAESTS